MTSFNISRRAVLIAAPALMALGARPVAAALPAMQVAKDPNCGCCGDWIAIMEKAGFAVSVTEMAPEVLGQHKAALGIPAAMQSCHTAQVEGYALEGHVPVADILRLLETRPDAAGLTVPGMPFGAPGMGPETERDAYDVHLIGRDGTTTVFSRYSAA